MENQAAASVDIPTSPVPRKERILTLRLQYRILRSSWQQRQVYP
jgi:hypothetical protein